MIRRAVFILCVLAVASIAKAEPTIGFMTELSGSFASNGVDCKAGYSIAIDEARKAGKNFRPVFGDTQGNPRTALVEMEKLTEIDKASVVVVNRSQVAMALASVVDREKIPLIGIVGRIEFVSQHDATFRAWPNAKAEGEALAKAAFQLGYRRIATVTLQDEYLTSLTRNFSTAFIALGGLIQRALEVLPTDSDFRTTVLNLSSQKPDALFVNLGIPQLGPFYKALSDFQIATPTLSNFWVQKPEVKAIAGSRTDGAVFVEAKLGVPKFVAAFNAKFGNPSNLMISYTCYVGGLLAVAALEPSNHSPLSNAKALPGVFTMDGFLPIVGREVQFLLVPKKILDGRVMEMQRPNV